MSDSILQNLRDDEFCNDDIELFIVWNRDVSAVKAVVKGQVFLQEFRNIRSRDEVRSFGYAVKILGLLIEQQAAVGTSVHRTENGKDFVTF